MLSAHCRIGFYEGSHDAFVFYVNGIINHRELVEVDVTPNIFGMENRLLWIFKSKLKYKILNPCKVLVVYHNHCVGMREAGRRRIYDRAKFALIPVSDNLR